MKTSILDKRYNFPLIIEPETQEESINLGNWCIQNKSLIDDSLATCGAILFRGFAVSDEVKFQQLAQTVSGELGTYVDGNSPRTKIIPNIYTSTEYPQELFISLHNELSYAAGWPERLYFCCMLAAPQGGETALADSRRILEKLDAAVVAEFRSKKIKYLRTLHGGTGFGQSWQQTFETTDPKVVEDYLRGSGTNWQWRADGGLSVHAIRPATAYHPRTGEEIWFNQADQFHPSTHPPEVFETMMMLYEGKEDQLPQNAVFGDGSLIPKTTLDHIRVTVADHIVDCRWQPGDFLMIDNMLVCHGRRPFTGKRRIMVAMSGTITWNTVGAVRGAYAISFPTSF